MTQLTLDELIANFDAALAHVTRLIDAVDGWGYEFVGPEKMRANPLPSWLVPNEGYTAGRVHAEHISGLSKEPTSIWQKSSYSNSNPFRVAMRETYRAARDVANHPGGLLYWKLQNGGAA